MTRLSGCYENLDGGNTADALVDFTGGVAESISLVDENYLQDFEKKKKLHKDLKKYSERKFLMSASIKVKSLVYVLQETIQCNIYFHSMQLVCLTA